MRRSVTVAALVCLVPGVCFAGASAAALEKLARDWDERGRPDRAEETWTRALAVEPASPEALSALAELRLRARDRVGAKPFIERLRTAAPEHPLLPYLDRVRTMDDRFFTSIAQARAAAKKGELDRAAALYRDALGDTEAPLELALEVLEVEAGTDDGWDRARAGLERLEARYPRTPKLQLALAKALSYRADTRAEALRRFEHLADDPQLRAGVREPWRTTLGWMGEDAAAADALAAFARKYPDDREAAARSTRLRRRTEDEDAMQRADEALEERDYGEAKRRLRALGGEKSTSAGVVAGLARIALAEKKFDDARRLFLRARALAPDRAETWARSLRSAEFWAAMDAGNQARAAGNAPLARQHYQRAIAAAPEQKVHALLALAELAEAAKDGTEARARLEDALAAGRVGFPAETRIALQRLLAAAVREGRFDDARGFNDELRRLSPADALPDERLESERLRKAAAGLGADGRWEDARAALLEARGLDGGSAWVLHDLAWVELQLRHVAEARAALDALKAAAPGLDAAVPLEARVLVAEGSKRDALRFIDALPDASRTPELRSLRAEVQRELRLEQVESLAERGRRSAARAELIALQRESATSPAWAPRIARAWMRLGDRGRAQATFRDALALPEAPIDVRLAYAGLLLELGDEDALEDELQRIEDASIDSEPARAAAWKLRVGLAVRRADRLREAGRLNEGFAELKPLLGDAPSGGDDAPELSCALARLYFASGDAASALKIYQRELELRPAFADAVEGAVQTAVYVGDVPAARGVTAKALEVEPESPRLLLVAGRLSLQEDDADAAAASLGRAWKLAAAMPELRADIGEQLQALRAREQPTVDAGFEVRTRSGEDGLGAVSELRLPITAHAPLGYRHRLSLTVVPTMLDADRLRSGDPSALQRFGGAVVPSMIPSPGVAQLARGVAVSAAYETRGFRAEAGASPLGFRLPQLVFDLRADHTFGPVALSANLYRRAVTDSLLSYGGAVDPVTGATWGGVTALGGRVDAAYLESDRTWYVYASHDRLFGTGVADNFGTQGGAGVDLSLLRAGGSRLVAGLALMGMTYHHNLRFFTLGHGGYFSPQEFLHAGVPFRWTGERAKLKWSVSAEPGIDWFDEEDAPWFPKEGGRQAARAAEVDATGAPVPSTYAGSTQVAFAFAGTARVTYALTSTVNASLDVDLRDTAQYQEARAGIGFGFAFGEAGAAER